MQDEALEHLDKLNEARKEALKALHDAEPWETWDAEFQRHWSWFAENCVVIHQDQLTGTWLLGEAQLPHAVFQVYIDGEVFYEGDRWGEAFQHATQIHPASVIELKENGELRAQFGPVTTNYMHRARPPGCLSCCGCL